MKTRAWIFIGIGASAVVAYVMWRSLREERYDDNREAREFAASVTVPPDVTRVKLLVPGIVEVKLKLSLPPLADLMMVIDPVGSAWNEMVACAVADCREPLAGVPLAVA